MRIFLYGTLRHDVPDNALTRLGLQNALQPIEKATLRGALWHVQDMAEQLQYPALDPYLKDGIVHGYLYDINTADLPLLDGWEDYLPYNEEGSLYLRREMMLESPAQMAWVYVLNPNKPLTQQPGKKVLGRIESGDWLDVVRR